MRKLYIGFGVIALALLLLTAAFAFSLTLRNLRLNALSFTPPAAAIIMAAPMSSVDESNISSPDARSGVRLEQFVQPEHVCNKTRVQERSTDF